MLRTTDFLFKDIDFVQNFALKALDLITKREIWKELYKYNGRDVRQTKWN